MSYDIWCSIGNIFVTLITWLLTVYFAYKSYRLEKSNKFHGKWYLQKVNDIITWKGYIIASFLNEWNVEWYITEFLIEVSYRSLKDKIKVLFRKKEKYIFMLYQNNLLSEWFPNQSKLPWHVEPRKNKIMYFDEKAFIKELNNLRTELWANIKNFVFRDSTYNLYKYCVTKKSFPELFN